MAEPPAAAPAGVVASERDALLATKLYVPGPVPGYVARPRLAGGLRSGPRPRRGGGAVGWPGRPPPPLPLARPRAGGQLAELRAGELRFTAEEAAVLLREATGADLPGPAVAALAARTEGWAAGLQLAALSLRGQADPAGFVAAFSGSHRYVLDYLAGEVLDRQPEEGPAFLLQTSAAGWLPARPVERVRPRPRLLGARAWLAATSGHAGAGGPPLDAAERALADAARAVDEPFEPAAGRAASMLVNVPALIALHRSYLAQFRGDAEATAAFASQALAELDGGEQLLSSTVQGFLAAAEWLRGRLAEAERAFVSSIAGWREAGQPSWTSWGVYQLGQVQRAQGRLDAAVPPYRQTLDSATGSGRPPPPTA